MENSCICFVDTSFILLILLILWTDFFYFQVRMLLIATLSSSLDS